MSKFTFKELVADGDLITAKLGTNTVASSGDLNGNDIGKPVKLIATDRYGLCSDGDQIDGFLQTVEDYTADGYAVGSVQISGRRRVEIDEAGGVSIGGMVEADAPAARTVAEANALGVVSAHAVVVTSTTTVAATTFQKNWRLISGTGADGDTTAIVEKI